MDRRELLGDQNESLLMAFQGVLSGVNTAMPGIIKSFDPTKQTCEIQPAIQAQVQQKNGDYIWVTMPLLVDVPVFFPSGGGFTLTFPVTAGDEALVVFSQRCIDAWYYYGQIQTQPELRMHDLSDGFAFVGISSVPRVTPGISTTNTQLRNHDGSTFVEVSASSIKLNAATVVINSPSTHVTGSLSIDGLLTYNDGIAGHPGTNGSNVEGDISIGGVSYLDHEHTGVLVGGDNTGGPVNP